MIYDTIANISRYKGIHRNLDTAIDYLTTCDLSALSNGRHDVDGDNVFVNVMDAEYRAAEDGRFEAHHTYADIQISFTGDEFIGWLPLTVFPEWDESKESKVFEEKPAADVLLPMKKGTFAILFPEDAHAPGIGTGKGRKAVAKVKVK